MVASGQLVAHQRELLDPHTRLRERLMLGLRLDEGVDLARAQRELGVPVLSPQRREAIAKLQQRGRVDYDGDRLRIPRKWWLLADGIASSLF